MRLILPGASGFVGRNFLLSAPRDWDVLALYYHDENFPSFIYRLNNRNVRALRCDLSEATEIRQVFRDTEPTFDACVYLAANSDPALSVRDPVLDVRHNIVGLVNFLSEVRITHMIYFSSGAVYEGANGPVDPLVPLNPRLPYAISKVAAENFVRFFTEKTGTVGSYINVRFFGGYGPYEAKRKIYTRLVQKFAFKRENRFEVRGDGRNLIDAMYIEDVVAAIHLMLSSNKRNITVDLCYGAPLTVDDLVLAAARVFGIENLVLEHRGTVPEYNAFHAVPEMAEELFRFLPKTTLAEGLTHLAKHLCAEQLQMVSNERLGT